MGRSAAILVVYFPEDGDAVQDSPRLTLIVVDPVEVWDGGGQIRDRIGRWTKERGRSPRLYPSSLVWCVRKPGRELGESIALWLAWQRVAREVADGVLGAEFDRANRVEVQARIRDAEEVARDEVWASYRFVSQSVSGLKIIDLGASHASGSDTLCGHIIGALKSGPFSMSPSEQAISTGTGHLLLEKRKLGRSPVCASAFSMVH